MFRYCKLVNVLKVLQVRASVCSITNVVVLSIFIFYEQSMDILWYELTLEAKQESLHLSGFLLLFILSFQTPKSDNRTMLSLHSIWEQSDFKTNLLKLSTFTNLSITSLLVLFSNAV